MIEMTQLQFYKSFQFMIELMVGESLFLISMKRRKYFIIRLVVGLCAIFTISYFFPIASDNFLYRSFMFISLFVTTIALSKFLFKESLLKLSFCCVAGYTIQHLAYQMNNIAVLAMTKGKSTISGMYGQSFMPTFSNPFFTIVYFFFFVCIYFFGFYIFGRKLLNQKFQMPPLFGFILTSTLLLVDVVLNAAAVYIIQTYQGLILTGVYNIVCCILGLFLQFEVLLRWDLFSQLRMSKLIRRYEKDKYEAVKEAMDIVNIKCHDLKHEINRLKETSTIPPDLADEMIDSLSSKLSIASTGNSALDVVLNETNKICMENKIRASYMADGSLISFIDEEDIYSLFSNLLDNAIEAVSKCPIEKRTMGIRIENKLDQYVSITVYNYCIDSEFVFSNGLPKTTKKHEDIHGFGLKSVKRICEKYDGTLDICPENNFFNVNILFKNTQPNSKK